MKIVKEYLCNDRTPTIDELKKNLSISLMPMIAWLS